MPTPVFGGLIYDKVGALQSIEPPSKRRDAGCISAKTLHLVEPLVNWFTQIPAVSAKKHQPHYQHIEDYVVLTAIRKGSPPPNHLSSSVVTKLNHLQRLAGVGPTPYDDVVKLLMRGSFDLVGAHATITISVKEGGLKNLIPEKPPPSGWSHGCFVSRRNPAIAWFNSLVAPYGVSVTAHNITVDLLTAGLILVDGFALSSYGERVAQAPQWCYDAYTANSIIRMASLGTAAHNSREIWEAIHKDPTSTDLAFLSLPQLNDAEFYQLSPKNVLATYGCSGPSVKLPSSGPATWAEGRRRLNGVLSMLGDELTPQISEAVLESYRPSKAKEMVEFVSNQGNVTNLSLEDDIQKSQTWTVSDMLAWEIEKNTCHIPMDIIRAVSYLDVQLGQYRCTHLGWAAVRRAMFRGSATSTIGMWVHINGDQLITAISPDCDASVQISKWSYNVQPTFERCRVEKKRKMSKT